MGHFSKLGKIWIIHSQIVPPAFYREGGHDPKIATFDTGHSDGWMIPFGNNHKITC